MAYVGHLLLATATVAVLSSIITTINAEMMAIEPTSPYLPRQLRLTQEIGYPAYSDPIRETPRFTAEKVYRQNPITGSWEWIDNPTAISPTQQ